MFISTTINKDIYSVYLLQEKTGNTVECFGKLENIDDFTKKRKMRQMAIDKFNSGEYNTSINFDNVK